MRVVIILLAILPLALAENVCGRHKFGYKVVDPANHHGFYVCLGRFGHYVNLCAQGFKFNESEQRCVVEAEGTCPCAQQASSRLNGVPKYLFNLNQKVVIDHPVINSAFMLPLLPSSSNSLHQSQPQAVSGLNQPCKDSNSTTTTTTPCPKQSTTPCVSPSPSTTPQNSTTTEASTPQAPDNSTTTSSTPVSSPNPDSSTTIPITSSEPSPSTPSQPSNSTEAQPTTSTEAPSSNSTASATPPNNGTSTEAPSSNSTAPPDSSTTIPPPTSTSDAPLNSTAETSPSPPSSSSEQPPAGGNSTSTSVSPPPSSESSTESPPQSSTSKLPLNSTTEQPGSQSTAPPSSSTVQPPAGGNSSTTTSASTLSPEPSPSTPSQPSNSTEAQPTTSTEAPSSNSTASATPPNNGTSTEAPSSNSTAAATPPNNGTSTEAPSSNSTAAATTPCPPLNIHLRPHIGKCDSIPPDCSSAPDGQLLRDRALCSKFYTCMQGRPIPQQCSDGLYFDIKKNVCNFKSLVDCQNCAHLSVSTISKLKKPANSSKRFERKPSCQGKANGSSIRDSKQCNKYFICRDGKAVTHFCSPGEWFDIKSSACNLKRFVECKV